MLGNAKQARNTFVWLPIACSSIGQHQEFGWTCLELPADCDGVTRDCFPDQFTIVSAGVAVAVSR